MSGALPALQSLVATFAPASVLLVGEPATGLFEDYLATHPGCRMETLPCTGDAAALAAVGRYDLAFVAGCLERLDRPAAGRLIAALRDVNARRLLVAVPMGPADPSQRSHWEMPDLLAFGLVLVAEYEREGRPVHVYAFDIATYKVTPDWLNSRYWANPELWDRFWW